MAEFTVPQRSSSVGLPNQLGAPESSPVDFGAGIGKALGDIAITIKKREAERQQQLDELYLLRRKSELSDTFNQARIEQESRTGEDALNIVNEQSQKWDEERLNKMYPNIPDRLRPAMLKMYSAERNSHLSKLTDYQLKEEKRYNTETRDLASFTTSRDAVDSPFGDLDAAHSAISDIKAIKRDDPASAQADIDAMLVSVVKKWARDNPNGIVDFVDQNEGFFQEAMNDKVELVFDAAGKAKKERETELELAEQGTLGQLFLNERYEEALAFLGTSKHLKGDYVRRMAKEARDGLKNTENGFDEQVQIEEINKANEYIAQGQDYEAIKFFIVENGKIKKEDKEQYLNKLETKFSSELDSGRREGYKIIYRMITPERGQFAKLLQTDLEQKATLDATLAFDEWLLTQQQQKKYPTALEIKRKAREFGQLYQPPMEVQIERKNELRLERKAAREQAQKLREQE